MHAFIMFTTRRVLRWTNNSLREAWTALDPIPAPLQPLGLIASSDDLRADGLKYSVLINYLRAQEQGRNFSHEANGGGDSDWLNCTSAAKSDKDPVIFRQNLVKKTLAEAQELRQPSGRWLM